MHNKTTSKEQKIIFCALLLLILPMLPYIYTQIASLLSLPQINDKIKAVINYELVLTTPAAYLLLSLAATNKAIKNILKIVAAAKLLSGFIFYIETSMRIAPKWSLLGITGFIAILAICYLWGAVKRNYKIDKVRILCINSYIILLYIILPLTDCFIVYKNFHYSALILINISKIILLCYIISHKVFCAASADIPQKEQYRFWNKFHLYWLSGVILLGIINIILIS